MRGNMGCRRLQFEDDFYFIDSTKSDNKGFSFLADLNSKTSENNTSCDDPQKGFSFLNQDAENPLEKTPVNAPEYMEPKNRYKPVLNRGVSGFRYFDWELGRFITRDPSGYPDGPNNYLYCHNNPINHIDPLGLDDNDEEKRAEFNASDATNIVSASGKLWTRILDKAADFAEGKGWANTTGALKFGAEVANIAASTNAQDMANSTLDSYDARRANGSGVYESSVMTVSERMPLLNMGVKTDEMRTGMSLGAHDSGRELSTQDYWTRGLSIGGESLLWGAGAMSHAKMDVNLTGPNKGMNPYNGKPPIQVDNVKGRMEHFSDKAGMNGMKQSGNTLKSGPWEDGVSAFKAGDKVTAQQAANAGAGKTTHSVTFDRGGGWVPESAAQQSAASAGGATPYRYSGGSIKMQNPVYKQVQSTAASTAPSIPAKVLIPLATPKR